MSKLKVFIKQHKHLLSLARACKHVLHPARRNWQVYSFNEVFGLAVDWAQSLPKDFDCIIGVPRSGLLIANVLASAMNKPLSTADDFTRGIVWHSKDCVKPSVYKRVLIVEDCVDSARALKEDIAQLLVFNPDLEIKTASLFANNREIQQWLDYCYAVTHDTLAEFHTHAFFKGHVLAVDLDGVLYDEVSGGPLIIPNFKVEAVVTARLELERASTESWLKSNGVIYNQLIMFDGSAQDRTFRNIAKFKAKSALRVGAEWFWESEPSLAKEISGLLGKSVYCPTNRLIYSPKSKWVLSFWKGMRN